MINAIHIALSGLAASTKRVATSASNIANLTTSGSIEDGGQAPYSTLTTTQESININGEGAGVKADTIPKNTPFVPSFDPDSPFANAEGVIGVPNTNLAEEAVNISLAETTFKANLKVIEIASELQEEVVNLGRDR
ncbi:MAG: flagellar basal body rod C-terminal domain-containing protein [Pseudomonadota bacterium]|nr:flagellar basal body rod C-terminal domain-containing protein [Pseudomonadota bacterium]MEC8666054.1 flagellar basal body rod C-terminal domain-containing protein [Pseudomonadota bacterium]